MVLVLNAALALLRQSYLQPDSFLTCTAISWHWENIMFPPRKIRLYFILKQLQKHKID
jgi:hypothetical protein